MSHARYVVGDVFDVLASMEPGSVDMVMTSPPFLALRSYLPPDHPQKSKEIGSEATPADFLDTLLDLVEHLDRVLAPHGSICIELGDTYSGSGGAGGDYGDQGLREGQPKFEGSGRRNRPADVAAGILAPTKRPGPEGRDRMPGWPMDKSLCGIPTLFAWSLAYGRNLLRPERLLLGGPWRIRNVVAWCRPNPPVGALGDKFRPATSYVTVATKSRTRYFDLDAVRTPSDYDRPNLRGQGWRTVPGQKPNTSEHTVNPAGAPPLDYWVIPTQPYDGSHYATYPEKLCEIPIKAMCPIRVCTVCGEPSRRIVSDPEYDRTDSDRVPARLAMLDGQRPAEGVNQHTRSDGANTSVVRRVETLGWTDCGHNAWRTGVVLDPFAGSGTTLSVATGHGRDAIGIDIDARNADLAMNRVGPLMLTVDHHITTEAAS